MIWLILGIALALTAIPECHFTAADPTVTPEDIPSDPNAPQLNLGARCRI